MTAWQVRSGTLPDRTLVMSIVNTTPDSFSDGGELYRRGDLDVDAAVALGLGHVAAGADIVDVGGESTRPGADPVTPDEEMRRVVPVVAALASRDVIVSIDTSKPEVAERAVAAGAQIVNDVTAFTHPDMASLCAEAGVGVVLMHMRGTPLTMQADPQYEDVVAEVAQFLRVRAAQAEAAGVGSDRICLDPGIGFGKTMDHNLDLLAHLEGVADVRYQLLVGTSRKRFLGTLSGDVPPQERDPATAATTALAIAHGATVVRVHNVVAGLQAARVAEAIVSRAKEVR